MYATTIIDTSFPKAWERAVRFVRVSPLELRFGGGREIKHALDSQTDIILSKHAIQEVLERKCHPSDPWGTENKIREYLKEYEKGFDASVFDYTYRKRLEEGFSSYAYGIHGKTEYVNQLDALREGLAIQIEEQISSNRNIAVMWNPVMDIKSKLATPCWNEILVRWESDGWVSIHDLFRSHDLFGAWGANKIATTRMLYNEVVKPNGCKIKYSSERNFSLHIYRGDMDLALNIKHVFRNPMLLKLQEEYNNVSSCDIVKL